MVGWSYAKCTAGYLGLSKLDEGEVLISRRYRVLTLLLPTARVFWTQSRAFDGVATANQLSLYLNILPSGYTRSSIERHFLTGSSPDFTTKDFEDD